MIPGSMIGWLADKLKIERKELIEKDMYLQGLLLELADSDYFSENFVFKGGTCLIKVYFGYYRFSEDLDFTWIKQSLFENKSENQIRRLLSREINRLLELFVSVSKKLELDFKPAKSNRRYVELGGSNRFATFKFWYEPTTSKTETFIKIQINFVEKIFCKPKKRKIDAIACKLEEQLEFLYPKYAKLATRSPKFFVYDLREIASEKVRALLTRRGFKTRDIVDLYVLSSSKKGVSVESVKNLAFEKTRFMLRYQKYTDNLKHKNFEELFRPGDEQKLMITELDDERFKPFVKKTIKQLNTFAEELRNEPGWDSKSAP